MKKFEYMSITTNQDADWPGWRAFPADMNIVRHNGKQGWELCSTIELPPATREYIFKREVDEIKE